MNLSRRHLAAAGALALSAPTLILSAHAQAGDEAAVKKAIEELRTAWLKQDKPKIEALTAEQLSYSHSDARLGVGACLCGVGWVGGMKQRTLAMATGFERFGKRTKRALFLEEMEQVVPWRHCVG